MINSGCYGTHPDPREAALIHTREEDELEANLEALSPELRRFCRFVQALALDAIDDEGATRELYYWWLRDHPEEVLLAVRRANILSSGTAADLANNLLEQGAIPDFNLGIWSLICASLYHDRAELYHKLGFVPRPHVRDYAHALALARSRIALMPGQEDHVYLLDHQEALAHCFHCEFCWDELNNAFQIEPALCKAVVQSMIRWGYIVQRDLRSIVIDHYQHCIGCKIIVAETRL